MNSLIPERIEAALKARRSIKHFDKECVFPIRIFDSILDAASSLNKIVDISPIVIKVAQDEQIRRQIRELGFDQPQFTNASKMLFICFNPALFNTPNAKSGVLTADGSIGSEVVIRDIAMRNCAMLSQAIMVSAAYWGYDSCPMIGFNFERVKMLLGCPEDWILSNAIALGRRAKGPMERGSKLTLDEVVLK